MKDEPKSPTLPEAAKELAKANKRLEAARKAHWESIEAMDAARRELQDAEEKATSADFVFRQVSVEASRKRFGLPEQMILMRARPLVANECSCPTALGFTFSGLKPILSGIATLGTK